MSNYAKRIANCLNGRVGTVDASTIGACADDEISRLQSANMELAEALRKIIAKDIEPVSAFNHADWRKLLGNARAALARHTTIDTTTMPPPDTHYSDPGSGQRMPAFGLRHLDEAYAEIDRLRGLLERVYRLHPSTRDMIDDAAAASEARL